MGEQHRCAGGDDEGEEDDAGFKKFCGAMGYGVQPQQAEE